MAKKKTVGRLKKAKRIREAGKQTEQEFFGKGGPLEVKNPLRASSHGSINEVDYMNSHGWELGVGTRQQPKVYYRTVGSDFQSIQKEAQGYRLLNKGFLNTELQSVGVFPLLTDAIIRADKVGTRKELFQKNPITVVGLANPGGETHFRVSKPGGRYTYFDRLEDAKAYAQQILDKTGNFASIDHLAKKIKVSVKRPIGHRIADIGPGGKECNVIDEGYSKNPSRSVHANIEGIIYNRCIEIRAEKTGYKKGFYKHPFSRGSQVCIYALDNGDLLVHSKAGVKLWQPD